MTVRQLGDDALVGGVVAGRYRVDALLGAGAMGRVYRAEHVALRRPVALKLVRPDLRGDPAMASRFLREARSASRIDSRHVITVFDAGTTEEGLLYLAMELLEGESLGARLDRERLLSPIESLRIAAGIARGLVAAHAAGVIHRDLKPDNVFLAGPERFVKLLDFGLARVVAPAGDDEHAEPVTRAGTVLGTPLYLSPEAVAGGRVGPPADLYALGVTLYEMVIGAPPIEGPTTHAILLGHLELEPRRLREASPTLAVPDELEALVARLLAKQPADRPDAHGALGALERILVRLAREEGTDVSIVSGALWLDDEHVATDPAVEPPADLTIVEGPTAPGSASPPPDRAWAPAEPSRRRRPGAGSGLRVGLQTGLVAALSAVAGMVVAVLIVRMGASGAEPPRRGAPSSAPAPGQGSPGGGARGEGDVRVELLGLPADATVWIAGRPLLDTFVRLPRDGELHEIVVEAPQHEARTLLVPADRDRAVTVRLALREDPQAGSAGRRAQPAPAPPVAEPAAEPVPMPATRPRGARARRAARGILRDYDGDR